MQKNFSFKLIAALVLLSTFWTCSRQSSLKPPQPVREIGKRAVKIELNKQGFWEAEFSDNITMVFIPAGEFTMGSDIGLENEKPVHKVHLDAFWLAKYPVTLGQFQRFINDTGYITDAEKGNGSWQYWEGHWVVRKDGSWRNPYFAQEEDHPVVSISWNDSAAAIDPFLVGTLSSSRSDRIA